MTPVGQVSILPLEGGELPEMSGWSAERVEIWKIEY